MLSSLVSCYVLRKNNGFQQRVARQSIGAMHSCVGNLSYSRKTKETRSSVFVGGNASAKKVSGRSDGNEVFFRKKIIFLEAMKNSGKILLPILIFLMPKIKKNFLSLFFLKKKELCQIISRHKGVTYFFSLCIYNLSPFSSQCFTQKEERAFLFFECCGMKLHKFHI